MSNSLLLDPRFETIPAISPGDYIFRRTWTGLIVIRNRDGQEKAYSVDALKQMGDDRNLPIAIRAMAWAALEWAEKATV